MTLFESGLLALLLGAVVVKPQELPGLGRRAGRLAGRAVRRLKDMKRELGEYVEQNDMQSVQEELQQTMTQLNRIRHDVRSVSSVRGIMMDFPVPSVGTRQVDREEITTRQETSSVGSLHSHNNEERDEQETGTRDSQSIVIPISARDLDALRHPSTDKEGSKVSYEGEYSGSRMLMDALKEERVARQALEFFGSAQQDRMNKGSDNN